jgi:3',5'-cyclic AMP phosphodiesterase CpdA
MDAKLRLAITADLHWGPHPQGNDATRQLLAFLKAQPPDVLILGGDVGASSHFGECLILFDDLACRKALVPGNHDLWVADDDARGDSLHVYRRHLPEVCAAHRFHYLDAAPLIIKDADVAVVGSINWYDYSWSVDKLRERLPDWEKRLRTKVFSRGRHNDARFIRWPVDDKRFTDDVVAVLESHLVEALAEVSRAIVVTHHPPFYELNAPRTEPLSEDGLLWDAFSGNRRLEELLKVHAERIPFAFCGHTHCARASRLGTIQGYNIGGDYHFKRLLLLDWPAGTVEEHTFGQP